LGVDRAAEATHDICQQNELDRFLHDNPEIT
jgi:hypothetical protein